MIKKNKKTLGIHLGLTLAELICASAFTIEIMRALSGNTLSWAYVFEWPLFAGYAIYMWRKLLNDANEAPATSAGTARREESDDALARYNEFLASVHHSSPREPPES